MVQWCRVADDEFPPEETMVWTWDGCSVSCGRWIFSGPGAPLAESAWTDPEGMPLRVTHWLPLEESEEPPAPPA